MHGTARLSLALPGVPAPPQTPGLLLAGFLFLQPLLFSFPVPVVPFSDCRKRALLLRSQQDSTRTTSQPAIAPASSTVNSVSGMENPAGRLLSSLSGIPGQSSPRQKPSRASGAGPCGSNGDLGVQIPAAVPTAREAELSRSQHPSLPQLDPTRGAVRSQPGAGVLLHGARAWGIASHREGAAPTSPLHMSCHLHRRSSVATVRSPCCVSLCILTWVVRTLRHGGVSMSFGVAFYLHLIFLFPGLFSSTSLALFTTSKPPPFSPGSPGLLVSSTQPLCRGTRNPNSHETARKGSTRHPKGSPTPQL